MQFSTLLLPLTLVLPTAFAIPPRTLEDRGSQINLGKKLSELDWKMPSINIPVKFMSKKATENLACKNVDELIECNNTCWHTYTPESDFYGDCQMCCRKACHATSWCPDENPIWKTNIHGRK